MRIRILHFHCFFGFRNGFVVRYLIGVHVVFLSVSSPSILSAFKNKSFIGVHLCNQTEKEFVFFSVILIHSLDHIYITSYCNHIISICCFFHLFIKLNYLNYYR